jgi:hypothetical protein
MMSIESDKTPYAGRWEVIDTWNGGEGGTRVRFEAPTPGYTGWLECVHWIHQNTSFSVHEAVTNQGYKIRVK